MNGNYEINYLIETLNPGKVYCGSCKYFTHNYESGLSYCVATGNHKKRRTGDIIYFYIQQRKLTKCEYIICKNGEKENL